jgi:NFU1 iron-sulfur cluster scaffold homolog, mitochondrial
MKTKEELQGMLDTQVNTLLAGHGGRVDVVSREDDVVVVSMSGGCQGCAGARRTLKSIVSNFINEFDPSVISVIDATDHSSGKTPYFKKDTLT